MTSQLADSLEAARPEDLVHIDREGRVRSPARYRAITTDSSQRSKPSRSLT